MAFFSIKNVAIKGIAASVPDNIVENVDLPIFNEGEAVRVIAQTGIERRHVTKNGVTASDLCVAAAEKLIKALNWEKNSIEAIVFVSTTADYPIPPTSCHIQHRLGLSESCMTFEIKNGCPGWVTAMASMASIVSTESVHRALVLSGDTPTILSSPKDKEVFPLFGDAGAVTALEFNSSSPAIEFEFGTKGKDYDAIIIEAGGARHQVNKQDLEYMNFGEHIDRRAIDQRMKGMDVFSFGINTAPKSIISLADHFDFKLSDIDNFFFHQANHYMNEKIRKKLHIEPDKVPYCMKDFGNTSCASIPLTIVTQRSQEFEKNRLVNVGCAFGIGLSWGSIRFVTDKVVCPELDLYNVNI